MAIFFTRAYLNRTFRIMCQSIKEGRCSFYTPSHRNHQIELVTFNANTNCFKTDDKAKFRWTIAPIICRCYTIWIKKVWHNHVYNHVYTQYSLKYYSRCTLVASTNLLSSIALKNRRSGAKLFLESMLKYSMLEK